MNKLIITRYSAKALFILIVVVSLSSCTFLKGDTVDTGGGYGGTVPADDYPEPSGAMPDDGDCCISAEDDPVKEHVWQNLLSYGEEYSGYGAYTYVLVGRGEKNEKSSALYFKLVEAILDSTSSASSVKHIPREYLNIFVIPVKIGSNQYSYEPNYDLSKALLTTLSIVSIDVFSRPGPYLITLLKPISNEENEMADILYIDLTTMHPASIPEVVRAYKNTVIHDDYSGIEELRSIRITILNLALVAEESIGFARAAYSDLKKSFSEPE
ncbi:MAG: hypothetical protein ACN4GM_08990 [Gammaproteobacteria bacterium]